MADEDFGNEFVARYLAALIGNVVSISRSTRAPVLIRSVTCSAPRRENAQDYGRRVRFQKDPGHHQKEGGNVAFDQGSGQVQGPDAQSIARPSVATSATWKQDQMGSPVNTVVTTVQQ